MVVSIGEREDLEGARGFRERHGLSYPVLADPRGGAYASFTRATLLGRLILPNREFVGLPYHVVINRQGLVHYAKAGSRLEEMSGAVEDLLARP